MHNICGCNKPDCKLCKQQNVFLTGKPVYSEDRNFLQDGPREMDRTAGAFFKRPNQDQSASVFEPSSEADRYLASLTPERAKQAAVFF